MPAVLDLCSAVLIGADYRVPVIWFVQTAGQQGNFHHDWRAHLSVFA